MSLTAGQLSLIIYIGVQCPLIFYFSYYLVHHFAEENFPKHTLYTLYLGFFCVLGLMLMIPIDVSDAVHDRKDDYVGSSDEEKRIAYESYEDDIDQIAMIYDVYYLVILLWANLVLCYQEYYNTDGYFTAKGRFASAFKRMMWDYVPIAGAGIPTVGILLGTGIIPGGISGLLLFSKIATNFVYETFLMFLIGYGLVEFPYQTYLQSDLEKQLKNMQTKAATEFSANMDAYNALGTQVANALKTRDKVSSANGSEINEAMEMIMNECPSEFRSSKYGEVAVDKEGNITVHTLAALRTSLNSCKSKYRMAQARLETCQMNAYRFQDMVDAKNSKKNANTKKNPNPQIKWSVSNTLSTKEEFMWLIHQKPRWCKIIAFVYAVISLFSFLGIISSIDIGATPISVFFHMKENLPFVGNVIWLYLSLVYVILTTTWSLFQLRGAGFELVPGRTTPESLSASCRMLMGLSFPLIFFYLGWIAENGINDGRWMFSSTPLLPRDEGSIYLNQTLRELNQFREEDILMAEGYVYMPAAFVNFYPLASIPFIKDSFGSLFPTLLFCFLMLIMTKAYNRACILLGAPSYQFGDPIVSEAQLSEGMKQLTRYKKIAERTVQRQEMALNRARKKVTITGGFWCFGKLWCAREVLKNDRNDKKKTKSTALGSPEESSMALKLPPPPELSGIAQYKYTDTKFKKPKWRDIFVIIKPPGVIYFLKDESANKGDDGEELVNYLPLPINLSLLIDCTFMSKSEKEGYRLKLELAQETIKLLFDTEETLIKFRKEIIVWKDYVTLLDSISNRMNSVKKKKVDSDGNTIDGDDEDTDEEEKELQMIIDAEEATEEGGEGDDALVKSKESGLMMTKNPMFAAAGKGNKNKDDKEEKRRERRESRKSVAAGKDKDKAKNVPETITESEYSGFEMLGLGSLLSPNKKDGDDANKIMSPEQKEMVRDEKMRVLKMDRHIDIYAEHKPKPFEGWLYKKTKYDGLAKFGMTSKWSKRYFRIVDSSHSLNYYKSTWDGEEPSAMIDLRDVEPILAFQKDDKADDTRFNIYQKELIGNERVYKLKAANKSEAMKWIHALNAWRDYFILAYGVKSAQLYATHIDEDPKNAFKQKELTDLQKLLQQKGIKNYDPSRFVRAKDTASKDAALKMQAAMIKKKAEIPTNGSNDTQESPKVSPRETREERRRRRATSADNEDRLVSDKQTPIRNDDNV